MTDNVVVMHARELLGSVSTHVVREAPCPVVVVPPGQVTGRDATAASGAVES